MIALWKCGCSVCRHGILLLVDVTDLVDHANETCNQRWQLAIGCSWHFVRDYQRFPGSTKLQHRWGVTSAVDTT